MKNIYTIAICYRIGCTIAVKSGKLSGNADTVMSIVSADALGLYKIGLEICAISYLKFRVSRI